MLWRSVFAGKPEAPLGTGAVHQAHYGKGVVMGHDGAFLFAGEFDGKRDKRVLVKIIGE